MVRHIFCLAAATLLVLGAGFTQPKPAQADGGFVAGLIIGGVASHVITRQFDHGHYYVHRRHVRPYRHQRSHRHHLWRKHVHWCHHRYKSYRERTNTWRAYSGHVYYCRSPYWG